MDKETLQLDLPKVVAEYSQLLGLYTTSMAAYKKVIKAEKELFDSDKITLIEGKDNYVSENILKSVISLHNNKVILQLKIENLKCQLVETHNKFSKSYINDDHEAVHNILGTSSCALETVKNTFSKQYNIATSLTSKLLSSEERAEHESLYSSLDEFISKFLSNVKINDETFFDHEYNVKISFHDSRKENVELFIAKPDIEGFKNKNLTEMMDCYQNIETLIDNINIAKENLTDEDTILLGIDGTF